MNWNQITKRALPAAVALALLPAAPASAQGTSTMSVAARSVWQVDHTTRLTKLTIGDGAEVSAPAGHSLTLTVNGIGTAIAPGTYSGDVVLTVTKAIVVHYMKLAPEYFRTALYVDNGSVVPEKSVKAERVGGTVTNTAAKDVSITSNQQKFNGIIVTGTSNYTIENAKIALNGNGANDFDGFGAGVMSSGQANVTIDHAQISSKGVARGAIFVGGHSTMHVNNSLIEVSDGILPAGYKFTLEVGKMLEVPWMLGISGNARATLVVENGTAYYDHDHIVAEGWGALSTDGVKKTRLYAKDSVIETIKSGYGSYSLGDSLNSFDHCTFNVADMALIMANGGSGTFTNGTVVNSRRFGVIMHSPAPQIGTLTIDKGSIFNTRSTVIQVKGLAANIVVDHATLNAGNGILLQAMVNDDPFAPKPKSGTNTPVTATFRDVTLNGDIVNSRTAQGGMTVEFKRAALNGAVSMATAAPAKGAAPTEKTYYLIGDVKNTFENTGGYGLAVSLDSDSRWTVTKTSYLSRLDIAAGAAVVAPNAQDLSMTVDGKVVPLAPGHYRGHIVLMPRAAR